MHFIGSEIKSDLKGSHGGVNLHGQGIQNTTKYHSRNVQLSLKGQLMILAAFFFCQVLKRYES